jgi:hypothetical protein
MKANDCTQELTYRSEALKRTSKAEKEVEEKTGQTTILVLNDVRNSISSLNY